METKNNLKEFSIPRVFLLFPFIVFLCIGGCSGPVPYGEDYSEIDASGDPVQIPHEMDETMVREERGFTYNIVPVADYKIAAMVVSKKSYRFGWNAKVSPIDLALVWGRMAEPEYDKYIKYSQSDRWYLYQYEPGSPFSNAYVRTHSSNNHIIPANENILKAIKKIKKREKVILEGYLVNVTGSRKGEHFWWNSSKTRTDTGDGSCEVFYVTKARIGNYVYE